MKSTYIYLNTYLVKGEFYYYVGSHTWDGPLGQVDNSYFGSSRVAENHKLKPIKVEILEAFKAGDFNILKRESVWINRFAEKYGIAPMACYYKGESKPSAWQSKFRLNGRLLNAHANSMENAIVAATSKEARKKAVSSRISNGNSNYTKLNGHASSKEVRERAVKTAKENGSMNRMVKALNSPESRAKAVKTSLEKGVTKYTSACATAAWVKKSRHYRVGDFVGTLRECADHLGLKVKTLANYARGWNTFSYKGIIFEIIC